MVLWVIYQILWSEIFLYWLFRKKFAYPTLSFAVASFNICETNCHDNTYASNDDFSLIVRFQSKWQPNFAECKSNRQRRLSWLVPRISVSFSGRHLANRKKRIKLFKGRFPIIAKTTRRKLAWAHQLAEQFPVIA